MAITATLGLPRIGRRRELKRALEAYWKGQISADELLTTSANLRRERWFLQRDLGIDWIPSNDFSLYDHVLDMAVLVGAIPSRFHRSSEFIGVDTYFEMARGNKSSRPMEMTKWFDTNYHYIVPEFEDDQTFQQSSSKPIDEFLEACELGIKTVPVLLGPITFLLLGKMKGNQSSPIDLLPRLLPVYAQVLWQLRKAGAEWVQIDEPCLVMDRTPKERKVYQEAYKYLCSRDIPKVFLTTYFDGLNENLNCVMELPVSAVHFDMVRAPEQLQLLCKRGISSDKYLSLGLVDGRNVWRNDLERSLALIQQAKQIVDSDRLVLAPSCSLLHTPWDLDDETKLDPEIKSWLSFSKQKLVELSILKSAVNEGDAAIEAELKRNRDMFTQRRTSHRVHNTNVQARLEALQSSDFERSSSYPVRKDEQQKRFQLPLFPTTTIGSFPQTSDVRNARSQFRKGQITHEMYEQLLCEEIARCIKLQEEIGLDVLVHGEFERTDMVEYFGEQMDGFAFTKNGWVQSYGSRCVKPPILYGDVSRPQAMTVKWSRYAQSLTSRLMKGMLTGPVTVLQWSFVRDDQPREETCRQVALAMRDEVLDLESAGIGIIQIDEPALREGLPLRRDAWEAYLDWAVDCFRLTAAGVKNETQIHTHMCYAEFHDIMPAIQALDADVISIETSRSNMELLNTFEAFSYVNQIGPGVYDIHSPRIPSEEEMIRLIEKACQVLRPGQLWVNPDCGLKTRDYAEVVPALQSMVNAAHEACNKHGFEADILDSAQK